ncbi:hypothetical protein [Thiorhodovibrio frisius]|uniref:Uncharacterized protein n=1 Tax=Thiorhodovibrio frisius TaxID=631362 RepID=H8YX73_9GAMM|nr:hypothetical protein [Thiorhodovibrio frisius]EIC23049.1 hypothetical protein Thi970DRAFT_00700 [Thiorhodovibrio frisius]WPL22686.1 hypothetical protein Thiofri_02856 [Thiorhodovibrio frisius]
MYLWKVDSLVKDFKSENVSQKEEFKYMLLFTVAMALASDPALYIGASYNHYDTIGSIVMLGMSIFGVYYCYKINSSSDNKDFIVRMMCIGLPVMIRMLVVMIPVFIVGGVLEAVFLYPESLDEETIESTPMQIVFLSIFIAAYYWYLSRKIKAVSSNHG